MTQQWNILILFKKQFQQRNVALLFRHFLSFEYLLCTSRNFHANKSQNKVYTLGLHFVSCQFKIILQLHNQPNLCRMR